MAFETVNRRWGSAHVDSDATFIARSAQFASCVQIDPGQYRITLVQGLAESERVFDAAMPGAGFLSISPVSDSVFDVHTFGADGEPVNSHFHVGLHRVT